MDFKKLIQFEGIDRGIISVQAVRLAKRLEENKIPVELIGQRRTVVARAVDGILHPPVLQSGDEQIHPRTEVFGLALARMHQYRSIVDPALFPDKFPGLPEADKAGKTVIIERGQFTDLAEFNYGLADPNDPGAAVPEVVIQLLNDWISPAIRPDLVIFLNLDMKDRPKDDEVIMYRKQINGLLDIFSRTRFKKVWISTGPDSEDRTHGQIWFRVAELYDLPTKIKTS